MSDTLTAGTPRRLLVDGRDPFADELVSTTGDITAAAPDASGQVFVSASDTAVDGAFGTVTVDPGADDTGRASGSDDITVSVPVVATPLAVTLE